MSVDTEPDISTQPPRSRPAGGPPAVLPGRASAGRSGRLSGRPVAILAAHLSGRLYARLAASAAGRRLGRVAGNVAGRLSEHLGAAGAGEIGERVTGALGDRFRLPGHHDPAPESNRLAGVCGWAAALALGGMAVALRAFVGMVGVHGAWYVPTVIVIGVIGLLCTIGAFASVHRHRLPWYLLGTASAALVTGWIATGL